MVERCDLQIVAPRAEVLVPFGAYVEHIGDRGGLSNLGRLSGAQIEVDCGAELRIDQLTVGTKRLSIVLTVSR